MRLGHRHVMIYQRNIMGTSIYHNMSGSQSCLLSFFMMQSLHVYFLSNFLNFVSLVANVFNALYIRISCTYNSMCMKTYRLYVTASTI